MQKDNTSGAILKTGTFLKLSLAILTGLVFSTECRAGWTQGGDGLISISIGLSDSSSSSDTNGSSSGEISLSSTNLGTTEWGDWDTVCHATASGSSGDSGVSVSVSQDTYSVIHAEASVLGFTAGAYVTSDGTATYDWDGPPWGPQGTAAEPPSVHLSIDCGAESAQFVSVTADLGWAQGSSAAGTVATIGILSDGGADDFYLYPVANASGIADTSPSADFVTSTDDGRTGVSNDNESYSPDSGYDIETPRPYGGPNSALENSWCSYWIQLEEDTELNQGSVSFEATAQINSVSGAHAEVYNEEHIGPVLTSDGYSQFTGSASVEISGITIH